MKIIKIKDRHGNLLDHDASQPIPDHCGIVTNLMIMDSTQQAIASRSPSRATITDSLGRESGHRPGHAYLGGNDEAEAAAQASYAASKARLADAWRGPSQFATAAATWPSAWHNIHGQSPQPDERTRNDAAVAREAWKARISSAGQTDAALVDNDPAWPGAWNGSVPSKPADRTLKTSSAREKYITWLSNQWKPARGDCSNTDSRRNRR